MYLQMWGTDCRLSMWLNSMHDRGKIFGIRSADSKLDRFAFSLLLRHQIKTFSLWHTYTFMSSSKICCYTDCCPPRPPCSRPTPFPWYKPIHLLTIYLLWSQAPRKFCAPNFQSSHREFPETGRSRRRPIKVISNRRRLLLVIRSRAGNGSAGRWALGGPGLLLVAWY